MSKDLIIYMRHILFWVFNPSSKNSTLRRPEFGHAEAELAPETNLENYLQRRMERVHEYCKYMPKDNVLEDLYTNEEFSLVDLPLVVDESFGLYLLV